MNMRRWGDDDSWLWKWWVMLTANQKQQGWWFWFLLLACLPDSRSKPLNPSIKMRVSILYYYGNWVEMQYNVSDRGCRSTTITVTGTNMPSQHKANMRWAVVKGWDGDESILTNKHYTLQLMKQTHIHILCEHNMQNIEITCEQGPIETACNPNAAAVWSTYLSSQVPPSLQLFWLVALCSWFAGAATKTSPPKHWCRQDVESMRKDTLQSLGKPSCGLSLLLVTTRAGKTGA